MEVCFLVDTTNLMMILSLNWLYDFLQVRWDDMEVTQHNRVSPWEIELSSYVSGASGLVLHSMKRSRIGFPTQPDLPVSRGMSWLHILFFWLVFSPVKLHTYYLHANSASYFLRRDRTIRLQEIFKVREGLARSRN